MNHPEVQLSQESDLTANQRRANTRPLGVPTHPTEVHNSDPEAVSTFVPQDTRTAPTSTKTERVERTTVTTGPGQPVGEISEARPEDHLKDSTKLESGIQQSPMEAQMADLNQMKHENHHNFENWEANRNTFVNDRLNIVDDLVAGMERTLDWLDIGVSKVTLFFKEREAQEMEYSKTVKHGFTQVGEHFDNSEHPDIMSKFSRVLKENDAFHAQDKKNSEILATFIQKDILDWVITPSEKNYKQQAEALLVPLHAQRKKLNLNASTRQKAYNKYYKAYDSSQKHHGSSKEDSLFKRQLKYSLAAREELRMLRLYNEQALSVITEFKKLSSSRLAEVQKVYSLYLQKFTELYKNNTTTPDPILELINQTNGPEEVNGFFAPKSLLTPTNYQFLVKIFNRDVKFEDLSGFLVNFPESIDPARSAFVVKEWEAVKQGSLLHKSRACHVIATKNNQIIVVEKKNEEVETGKVKNPMQMRSTRVEEIESVEDGTILRIVEKIPGTLFSQKRKTKLKFETQADAQEFMQIVNSQQQEEPAA